MSSPPAADEHTPLLNGNGASPTFGRRVTKVLKAEGEPSWLDSLKFFIFGSWLNVALVFVPLSIISHHANWDAALRFSFSFIAIMPLAAVRYQPSRTGLCTGIDTCIAASGDCD